MKEEGQERSPVETLDLLEPASGGRRRGGGRPARGAIRDLTTGSIPRNLFHLSWPQVVEGMVNVLDQLLDLVWAGRIGPQTIAGLGVGQTYAQLAMTGRQGLDVALRAMVARAVGAREMALANHAVLQAFTLSGGFSLLMILIGVLLTEPLLRVLGVSDAVVAQGANYMRIMFVAQGAIAFRMMSGSALQAAGDAITPMKATMLTRVVHLVLSPCLVFGLLFFPALGIAGAALANAIGQLFGVALNFHALFTGRSRLHLSFRGYRLDFPLLWRIIKLGAPASVTAGERSMAQVVLVGIVATFGDYALAAFSLTRRAQMVMMMGSRGLGNATGIIAGQSLGAGRPERARQTVYWGVAYVTLARALVGSLLFIFPTAFLGIFNKDPQLLDPGTGWLRIMVIGWILMGGGMVFMQTFNISGDTLAPMIVTLVTIWGVQQPAALLLPRLWGLEQFGVAWAINVAMASRLLFFIPYFYWGPWQRKAVFASRGPTAEALAGGDT